MTDGSDLARTPLLVSGPPRTPASRLGIAVVHDLVTAIVRGEVGPEQPLPPEAVLSQTFGVSRTVIRESIKRIEEKGLVAVEQGRGTIVRPASSWNVLDPIVLSEMVENDSSLSVLDDLAMVRASLEATMAALAASLRSQDELVALGAALDRMGASLDDAGAFGEADAEFHLLVMTASRNTLANTITRILFQRARDNRRFKGVSDLEDRRTSFLDHQGVLDAIEAGDPERAAEAMRSHITSSWARRRPY